jgi:hypothetical protein
MKVARIENGVVAQIFLEGQTVALHDRNIAFKHVKTWIRQNDPMAARYSLVEITRAAQPVFDPKTHFIRPVEAVVGGQPVDTWKIVSRPNGEALAELTEQLKDRAWELWTRAFWDKTRTAWFDYRDALKTHGVSLVQAFNQGKTVDPSVGSIDGVGGWPT